MNVFDQWRAVYDELTPAGHRLVAELMAMIWPDQRHYSIPAVLEFLSAAKPRTVMEFGGYDGALAAEVLPLFPALERWTNHDIVRVPQVCTDSRYELEGLRQSDVLIASHSFEHVKSMEIIRVVEIVDPAHIFVDSPLTQSERPDWDGYQGTHILSLSWDQLAAALVLKGYRETGRWNTNGSHARSYKRAA